MKRVLYVRVSTLEQKTDRQKVDAGAYDLLLEDKCSGAIPFFERPAGSKLKLLIADGSFPRFTLHVTSIDRMGRDLRDIVNTIYFFTQHQIPIFFISQGLVTMDADGKENPISKMVITMLGVVGEMERNQIKERQREGIAAAKLKGAYTGRKAGSMEDAATFLTKSGNKAVVKYLRQGMSATRAAKLAGVSRTTATKVSHLVAKL